MQFVSLGTLTNFVRSGEEHQHPDEHGLDCLSESLAGHAGCAVYDSTVHLQGAEDELSPVLDTQGGSQGVKQNLERQRRANSYHNY